MVVAALFLVVETGVDCDPWDDVDTPGRRLEMFEEEGCGGPRFEEVVIAGTAVATTVGGWLGSWCETMIEMGRRLSLGVKISTCSPIDESQKCAGRKKKVDNRFPGVFFYFNVLILVGNGQ